MTPFIIFTFLLTLNEGWSGRWERQYDVSYGSPAYKHCVCGRKNYPLVGDIRSIAGSRAQENEYPWMALITGNNSLIAVGSLINDRYVITVAHIIRHRVNEIKVALGKHDICQADTQTVIFSVEKILEHPDYNSITDYADIMLIKLSMKITFNDYIRPICLPRYNRRVKTVNEYHGKTVTTLMWELENMSNRVCNQREMTGALFKLEDCKAKADTAFCVGIRDNGHSRCVGESGNPLQIVNIKGKYELIGISSTRFGCETDRLSFYTDVRNMLPWIMKITTHDSMYCWR